MAKINTVVILCNGILYGTWLLPAHIENFSNTERNNLRHAIKEKIKEVGTKDEFNVSFDEILLADSVTELTDGILESIENSYP